MADDNVRDVSDLVEKGGEGVRPGAIIAGVVLVLFVIFVVQNFDSGTIQFLWMAIEMPVWVFAVVIFALGIAFGWFARVGSVRRKAKKKK